MTPATLRPRPAKDPTLFYDELALTLKARREALTRSRNATAGGQPLTWRELEEWLRFQCWYQQEQAWFIDSWFHETAGNGAFAGLCRKVSAGGRHHRLLLDHLESLGISMDNWSPEPEWTNWVSEFYAGGSDTLERVIAHNLTGELANLDTLAALIPHVPEGTRQVLQQIQPDLTMHRSLGRMAMGEYATTPERQARLHAWVMRSFELEQKAWLAFDRRIRALRKLEAANDGRIEADAASIEP